VHKIAPFLADCTGLLHSPFPADIQRLPSIERKEFFDAIFDITAYRPPANIQLPESYHPPSLAISKLYWKGWLLLLVLSAFNPKTIGAKGWDEYPMLRGMMEMVMTNNLGFPMSMNLEANEKGVTESKDSAILKEMQLARSEKETILEYENHLASSSGQKVITESTSYLVNQVTLLSPK
jgi:integrator complex subunit 1